MVHGGRTYTDAWAIPYHKLLVHQLRTNKKFELMLTRRAKVYSSSCLQIVFVYLQPFHLNSLLKWALQPKITKKTIKFLISEVQGLSKSSMLIRLKSSSLVLIVIGSMPMPICNHFHERLANNSKITTFTGVPLFDAIVRRFPWT